MQPEMSFSELQAAALMRLDRARQEIHDGQSATAIQVLHRVITLCRAMADAPLQVDPDGIESSSLGRNLGAMRLLASRIDWFDYQASGHPAPNGHGHDPGKVEGPAIG